MKKCKRTLGALLAAVLLLGALPAYAATDNGYPIASYSTISLTDGLNGVLTSTRPSMIRSPLSAP